MKITKVETFLVRWGDVSQPAEAGFGSTSATAVVAIHADGMVGLGEASPMQGGVASLQVIARDTNVQIGSASVAIHGVVDRSRQARTDVTLFNSVRLDFTITGTDGASAAALVEGFKKR